MTWMTERKCVHIYIYIYVLFLRKKKSIKTMFQMTEWTKRLNATSQLQVSQRIYESATQKNR